MSLQKGIFIVTFEWGLLAYTVWKGRLINGAIGQSNAYGAIDKSKVVQ